MRSTFVLLIWISLCGAVQGAAYPAPASPDWMQLGRDQLKKALNLERNTNRAKNVILMVGDGMDATTITASRIYEGQLRGDAGEENAFAFETFPYVALSKTYSVDAQISDSASTATALVSGIKTNTEVIGLDEKVQVNDGIAKCDLVEASIVKSILYRAYKAGKSTGVISTARITHATPASTYAHLPFRNFDYNVHQDGVVTREPEKCTDAATQLIRQNYFINVVMGGGRRAFYPKGTPDPEYVNKTSKRDDNLDLIQEWIQDKATKGLSHAFVWNETEFNKVDPENTDFLLGLFEWNHMQYESDRQQDPAGEPSLEQMTEKAIKILRRNDKGFFLMVEGARIDLAHHDGTAQKAMVDTIMFNKAVKKALELTDAEDTLIVVTADHGHPFTFGGYSSRGNNILGPVDVTRYYEAATDGLPYLTLGYANGPGYGRKNVTAVDYMDKDHLSPATVPAKWDTHGAQDVPIYAYGPMAHLFHSTQEQSYVAHVMMFASCLGPYEDEDHCKPPKKEEQNNKGNAAVTLSVSKLLCAAIVLINAAKTFDRQIE